MGSRFGNLKFNIIDVCLHSPVPEEKNTLVIRRLCNTVTVDWSGSFHLNGLLKNFEFLVNNNLMDSTISVTKTVGDLIYGTRKLSQQFPINYSIFPLI